MRPAAHSPLGRRQRWQHATGNDEGVRRRAPSGRREWREKPDARCEPDERQPWTRWKITREQRKKDSGAPTSWRAKCQISGFGRPLRFEHWGARGDLSPTDPRPISSRDLSWKQRTTQGTRDLYWFGPPLGCNTLLQCGGGGLPLGLMMNSTREEQPRERCS